MSDSPRRRFEPAERRELAILYGVIAVLHLLGAAACLLEAVRHPAIVGLGVAAYLLGVRHAFDVDHIAAVDDTVRLMLHAGRNPLGVGFFFSLGHATVVLFACVGVAVAAAALRPQLGALHDAGAIVGGAISGVFLLAVGLLNLRVLLDIARAWRTSGGAPDRHVHAEAAFMQRGLLRRLLRGRAGRGAGRSWQMYPVGLLFGLGFDTASEIALLALAAGASAASLPLPAVLALPVLFAAGMSLVDTSDGVFMCEAYRWAFVEPRRKLLYNFATTAFSVGVALVVGSVELAQASIASRHAGGAFADLVRGIDFGALGYAVAALFAFAWGASWLARQLAPRLRAGRASR